jgi:hypothetical protein
MRTLRPRNDTPSISSRNRCSRPSSPRSAILPPAPTTRCHGNPSAPWRARTVKRAARGNPAAVATWPYVITLPRGTRAITALNFPSEVIPLAPAPSSVQPPPDIRARAPRATRRRPYDSFKGLMARPRGEPSSPTPSRVSSNSLGVSRLVAAYPSRRTGEVRPDDVDPVQDGGDAGQDDRGQEQSEQDPPQPRVVRCRRRGKRVRSRDLGTDDEPVHE